MNARAIKKWCGIFLWLVSAYSLHAAPERVRIFISESAKPANDGAFWVGQKVPVIVEVLSETHFSGSTRFSLPDIPGAVFYKPEGRAVVMSREIDETTYSVQRHELAFYPQRAGAFAIPTFSVRFGIAGRPGESVTESNEKTQALTIRAVLPKGAENLRSLISTTDLKVTESWSPNPALMKGPLTAGNAIKRSITYQAPDIPGMAFPEIHIPETEGLKIYRSRAEVNDKLSRGTLLGQRIDSLTYVCEQAGSYSLPAVTVVWWNLNQERLETITLPEVTFEVIPSPQQVTRNTSEQARSHGTSKWLLFWVCFVLIGCGLMYWFKDGLLQMWTRWRHSRKEGEAVYFKRITPDLAPVDTFNALQQWHQKLPSSVAGRSLSDFIHHQNNQSLQQEWETLQLAVVDPTQEWAAGRLVETLRQIRKQLSRKGDLIVNHTKILTLSDLNPK